MKVPRVDELIREQMDIGKRLDEFLMQNADKMSLSGRKRVDLYASVAKAHLSILNKEKEKMEADNEEN